jgi:hypothetical protein
MAAFKLFGTLGSPTTQAAQICSSYSKSVLIVSPQADYKGSYGPKQSLILETGEGVVFGGSSICKYFAGLRPGGLIVLSLKKYSRVFLNSLLQAVPCVQTAAPTVTGHENTSSFMQIYTSMARHSLRLRK